MARPLASCPRGIFHLEICFLKGLQCGMGRFWEDITAVGSLGVLAGEPLVAEHAVDSMIDVAVAGYGPAPGDTLELEAEAFGDSEATGIGGFAADLDAVEVEFGEAI